MLSSFTRNDWLLLIGFSLLVLVSPWTLEPFGAAYPDILQKFAIFGIFAIGFNILFGLTGYLSFGHAAFIGVGSYVSVWCFKLLTMNVVPAVVLSVIVAGLFALLIGYVSLRRSGIYFSILTLAFAQMSYNLAYSVLTPITNLFGMKMSGYEGFYFCAVILIVCIFITMCIFKSNFGTMLRAIKSNQNRLNYTGIHTRPYLIAAFVISGMYAGLAGSLLAVTDPIAGAERMQWTASGEVVLMTILGGAGTLIGPVLGAGAIKFAEQKVSSWNEGILNDFWSFLPEGLRHYVVEFSSIFVGEGWHMTLGLLFMLIVIFLPGGLMQGVNRLIARITGSRKARQAAKVHEPAPAAGKE